MHTLIKGVDVRRFLLFLGVLAFLASCKKKDDYEYQITPQNLYPTNAGKVKLKTDGQYVSILYANLFQTALSSNELFRITQCIESVGDKELVREVIISNFMNKSDVILPTNEEMRADIDAFLEATYERFYVRKMTEAERTWFRNYIESNPNVTPELVYFSFALSNEYLFY